MRKSINFDLDTSKLKEFYPNKNYTQAYDDIKRFLTKNGFEHTQGSGYISKEELDDAQTTKLLKKINKKYGWFVDCCKTLHYSDVQPLYDGLAVMKEDKALNIKKEQSLEKKKPFKPKNKSKSKNQDLER